MPGHTISVRVGEMVSKKTCDVCMDNSEGRKHKNEKKRNKSRLWEGIRREGVRESPNITNRHQHTTAGSSNKRPRGGE